MGVSMIKGSKCKTSECTATLPPAGAARPQPGSKRRRAPPPNPNPRRFEIEAHVSVGAWTVVKVRYPDATNYEGRKVMLSALRIVPSAMVLFWSHFAEDTYIPVVLWAKYIRRPPEMAGGRGDVANFVAFASTPLGKILMIAIDQIVHLTFLWVVVAIALWPEVQGG